MTTRTCIICQEPFDTFHNMGRLTLCDAHRKHCNALDCDKTIAQLGYCQMHFRRLDRTGRLDRPCVVDGCNNGITGATRSKKCVEHNEGHYDHAGYPRRYDPVTQKHVLVHRSVMEQKLGRPLQSHETVHHKNGDRTDYREDNLELWSKSQPPGQRVEDKIEWMLDFLSQYGVVTFNPR